MAITNLKYLIVKEGLPQYRIAGLIGIHPSQISSYVLGQKPIPDHHLRILSEFFQLPPEDIVGYFSEDETVTIDQFLVEA